MSDGFKQILIYECTRCGPYKTCKTEVTRIDQDTAQLFFAKEWNKPATCPFEVPLGAKWVLTKTALTTKGESEGSNPKCYYCDQRITGERVAFDGHISCAECYNGAVEIKNLERHFPSCDICGTTVSPLKGRNWVFEGSHRFCPDCYDDRKNLAKVLAKEGVSK